MSDYLTEIFDTSNDKKIDAKIILEIAPLIFGLRVANIISISREEFIYLKSIFYDSDLAFYVIAPSDNKLSILVYREKKLKEYLSGYKASLILKKLGYNTQKFYGMMYTFSLRYKAYINNEAEFPHEMGLFLGYPIEDVIGFIKNDGKNFLAIGYWKVYEDVSDKERLFERFEEAKKILTYLVYKGMNIKEIVKLYYYKRTLEA